MKRLTLRQAVFSAVCILCILLLLGSFGISYALQKPLSHQQMRKRWDTGQTRYAQVSAYISAGSEVKESEIAALRRRIDAALTAASLKSESENARLWVDAYSKEGQLAVSRGSVSYTANATGIGGDFFLFHPLDLVCGSYIAEDDLMHDRVVIDTVLSWHLYGSSNAVGMDLTIGGETYYVAGVVEPSDGGANKVAYGDKGRIFLFLEHLEPEKEADFTCYEAILPSPVSGFALKTMQTGLGLSDMEYESLENSNRYSLVKLFGVISSYGTRSAKTIELSYPFWENAARSVEDYLALLLVFQILLILFPAICASVFAVKLWRRRKWRLANLQDYIEGRIDKKWTDEYEEANRKKAEQKQLLSEIESVVTDVAEKERENEKV